MIRLKMFADVIAVSAASAINLLISRIPPPKRMPQNDKTSWQVVRLSKDKSGSSVIKTWLKWPHIVLVCVLSRQSSELVSHG